MINRKELEKFHSDLIILVDKFGYIGTHVIIFENDVGVTLYELRYLIPREGINKYHHHGFVGNVSSLLPDSLKPFADKLYTSDITIQLPSIELLRDQKEFIELFERTLFEIDGLINL